ncbi:MAG: hypothetical protein RIQ99_993 [Pseudomonadota bacterium]|jgi:hypothetical protein
MKSRERAGRNPAVQVDNAGTAVHERRIGEAGIIG